VVHQWETVYVVSYIFGKVRGDEWLTIACQAKYEDCEERLDNANGKDEDPTLEESHLGVDLVICLAKSGSGVRLLQEKSAATFGVNRRRRKMRPKTFG
jgi:hypothetical protein